MGQPSYGLSRVVAMAHVVADLPGEAEVGDLEPELGVGEDVGRLEVAVEDRRVARVQVRHTFFLLLGVRHTFLEGRRAQTRVTDARADTRLARSGAP